MSQNQHFSQHSYTQPQNIYQQLGKPQPQPHLQSAYQLQPQNQQVVHVPQQHQQFQDSYLHHLQNQTQPAPSARGFQPPNTPFPNASGLVSQQQPLQPQQYHYSQPSSASTPVSQASGMYQSPSSRLPTSSFANLAPGQPLPNILTRQLGSSQQIIGPENASSGQLVPASQSLILRGQSPASSPGPPISPSAIFAQQANQQRLSQLPSQQQQEPQNHQQFSSLSLAPADRNSVVVAKQRQSIPPSHIQLQPQPQPQVQPQAPSTNQNRSPALPPQQPVHDLQIRQRSQSQTGQVGQTRSVVTRRPLPTPGAPRTFPSVNTINSASPASASPSNASPNRDNMSSKMATQLNSPTKFMPNSPTKALSSQNQTNRPLPAPGSRSSRTSGAEAGSGGMGLSREGFAGIGAQSNSSRIMGLPIDPSVSSLVAGIQPHKLTILSLPDESNQEQEDSSISKPFKTASPTQTGSSLSPEGSSLVSKRQAASPQFQSSSLGATSGPSSPTKESSSLTISSGQKLSPTTFAAPGQHSHVSDGVPTKKSTPIWKRTIPEYPQPAFGYATGMVKDPWTKPASSTSQKQNVIQAKPTVNSSLTQAVIKPVQADLNRQRAFVERQHIERQLNAAMAQAYAQNKRHRQNASMPVSGASDSAYAMFSRSNPDLHQMSDQHVRSVAYDYRDDDDEEEEEEEEEEESDSKDDDGEETEETEETEEEREVRPKKQGKKASEVSIHKKKKKKKGMTESKGKGKEKEKKVTKKIKLAPRSASMPPKKRTARQEISSTSEDDADSTEPTPEETEVEEEDLRRAIKHKKSFSVSSSRFQARVEREREALREKRPRFYYDYLPGGYHDDEDTPRKSIQLSNTRRQWSPRHSYHQWGAIAELKQRSPSPPPHTRASRRISPPRVSLLKDAQRRTIRLRGDDEDEFDDRGRERQQEMDRRKHNARYRSQERFYDEEYAENERRHPIHYPSSPYHKDGGGTYYGSHDYRHQEEREAHYSLPRAKGGQNAAVNMSGPPQPPTMTLARRRDTVELQENTLSDIGSSEREHKMFNLGRQEVSTRYPVRDEAHATSYRSRPASPERNFSRHQIPPSIPAMSPYPSQPSSPTKQPSGNRGNEELVMKFSTIDVKDRGKNMSKEGEWPADLPRLPRTPGETPDGAGDYFSGLHHQDGYFDGSGASTERARISGRTSGGNEHDPSYGSSLRSGRRDARSHHHYDNLNMNLDDPPPRSVSPALSQESTSYNYSEQPQQPQSSTNHGTSSKTYASVPTNRSMQRQEPSQQPLPTVRSRPQSQMYNLQMTTPPTAPEPPRPQSINPYVREQMNKTKINNGTPKVQTIDIESPAPVGGREKRADLGKMMSGPEDFRTPIPAIDGNDRFSHQRGDTLSQGLEIEVNSPIHQVNEQNGRQVHSPEVDSPRESPMTRINSSRGPTIQVDSPQGVPSIQLDSSRGPVIQVDTPQVSNINDENSPCQNVTGLPNVQVFEVPGISVSRSTTDDKRTEQRPTFSHPHQQLARPRPTGTRGSLICGGCDGPIIGRIVSAMGSRWHPQCFKCTVCGQLLEHVSSYEHDGKPYCHLDYHENFAPRCFSCKTAIIEERFISLDDPALGKRAYHEQHFFCAECGDPFLAPSMNNSSRSGELSVQGDGEFESDDVGFTVYKGHPYCEACHVRLRLPKCKRCKKSIRDHEQAVEALGGKWCWGCFVCASCEKPFENPSFFQRGDKPFCERCFDIMLRNEV